MREHHTFFVPGVAAPQGSKRYLGRGVLVESSKRLPGWRSEGGRSVVATFWFPRPKAHFGSGRNAGLLRPAAPPAWAHTNRPDLDKLLRAVLDALTGVAWLDDSQVIRVTAAKRWCDPQDPPGLTLSVAEVRP